MKKMLFAQDLINHDYGANYELDDDMSDEEDTICSSFI